MTSNAPDLELRLPASRVSLHLPAKRIAVDQDEEWFEVVHEGRRRRIGMHDYAELYDIPGLYEDLVYRTLKCRSPLHVLPLLEQALADEYATVDRLRALDLGAGNGIVGELLRQIGVPHVLGLDLLPEAARAARRDRPGVYDDYVVTDLTRTDPAADRRLRDFAPNCLVTIAALGFGDVPPDALARAFNLLPAGGWLAMGIKERFLEEDDDTGFGRLVRGMLTDGVIEVARRRRYVHRLSIAGEKLHYVALVARKRRHVGSAP
jgi:predicted TPR repeat methyltransferase